MRNLPGRMLLWLACLSLGITAVGLTRESGSQERADAVAKDKKTKGLPLEPSRKVEFTTDEATWLSLDVSPDGKTILFELLGDLYALPMEGGRAALIAGGPAFDSQPRYAPDGKWITFISDRDGADNVWIARPDGSEARKLTRQQQDRMVSPTWTPDGHYVIASKSGAGYELWMYHVNGGSGIQITKSRPTATTPADQTRNALGAVASPDGRFLYYAHKVGRRIYNMTFPEWQIARRDLRTGDEDILTREPGSAIRPLLSPDGRQLVYGTRHETQTGLRIRNLESGEDRWLIYPIQRDDQESAYTRDLLPGYAFTPDGRYVLLTFGGKIQKVAVADGAVTTIPFEADITLDIGPSLDRPRQVDQGAVRARLIQDAKQSPDGKRVAFSVLTKVYVMDLPGGTPKRLTRGNAREFKPAWSQDGQWIAYVTWTAEGGQVWRMRADGGGSPSQLTRDPAFYTDIVYSPDGSRIVGLRGGKYMRNQVASEFGGLRIPLDLVWLPADGGEVRLVVPARGTGSPHFADDPERIYVYSREGLLSVRYDGTDRRTHLKVTGKPRPPAPNAPPADDVRMRPDGRWALASVNNQLHVVAVPAVGGDPPSVNVFSPSVASQQITDIGADYFEWADGGKTITWAIGSTFFRRPFDTITFEPPRRSGAEKGEPAGEDEPQPEKSAKEYQPRDRDERVEAFEVVLEFPRHRPEGAVVLRGGNAVTMKGDEILRDADIVVEGNRITAIGPRGRIAMPQGARVLDVKGTTIVPGFVDTHAHYELRTASIPEIHNWSFLANLAYGVTTGLDVQTSTNDYFIYEDLVDIGETLGPRAYLTGPGVFSSNDFQSYEQTRSYLERYKKHYRTENIKSYMVGNRKQRQWVVMACKELGLMPTTEGGLDLKLDLTHALDGFHGNEHSLPIVPLYKDVVELFSRAGTAYTPTLLVLYGGPWAENYFYETTEVHDDSKLNRFVPHDELDRLTKRRPWFREDEHSFSKTAASAAKVLRAGGLIGVGAHGQLQGLGYHWEMWAFAMGGMTPMEVLRSATINGAKIVGVAQDLGSIETGKLADLVILEKDPLQNIRNTNTIRYVMKNGEIFDGNTLKQIWPIERELPPLPWADEKPKTHGLPVN